MPFAFATAPSGRTVRMGLFYPIREDFDPEKNAADHALAEGLRSHGYEIGRNLIVEFRSAAGRQERLAPVAAELAKLKIDLIVAQGPSAAAAARKATQTIPIVMLAVPDPVSDQLVASLARPGGNVTGLSTNAAEMAAKRVQLLKEAVPNLTKVTVLWNASIQSMTRGYEQIEKAAPSLGVTVQSIRLTSSADFDRAFADMDRARPQGLVVLFGPLRGNDLPRLDEYVTKRKIPSIFEQGPSRGGGLMEFGADLAAQATRVGEYVDKIANGAKPADLPVEEPTKFYLKINLKAARALGLNLPASLLLRADQLVD